MAVEHAVVRVGLRPFDLVVAVHDLRSARCPRDHQVGHQKAVKVHLLGRSRSQHAHFGLRKRPAQRLAHQARDDEPLQPQVEQTDVPACLRRSRPNTLALGRQSQVHQCCQCDCLGTGACLEVRSAVEGMKHNVLQAQTDRFIEQPGLDADQTPALGTPGVVGQESHVASLKDQQRGRRILQ